MNNRKQFIESLHQSALACSSRYFKAEAEMIEVLQRIDHHKAYREFGHTALLWYAVKELKLSESVALNFINVARKAVEVPALKSAIAEGKLTVSKARKIVSVLKLENQSEWIEKAVTLPQKKLEKEVARVCPKAAVHEKTTYVTDERIALQLGISERLLEKLRRVQDLESQRTKKAVTLEDCLEVMTNRYLEKNDPNERAKNIKPKIASVARQTGPCADGDRQPVPIPKREAISAELKRQVGARDQFQCVHLDHQGQRCPSRRWLEIHHRNPIALGGQNTLQNLATLCSAHHRMQHGPRKKRLTALLDALTPNMLCPQQRF